MAHLHTSKVRTPIEYHLKRHKLSKTDLCRLLSISRITLAIYIKNPFKMRLEDIVLMAGFFKVDYLELINSFAKNKCVTSKEDKEYLRRFVS